jgi:hypothetical protein
MKRSLIASIFCCLCTLPLQAFATKTLEVTGVFDVYNCTPDACSPVHSEQKTVRIALENWGEGDTGDHTFQLKYGKYIFSAKVHLTDDLTYGDVQGDISYNRADGSSSRTTLGYTVVNKLTDLKIWEASPVTLEDGKIEINFSLRDFAVSTP